MAVPSREIVVLIKTASRNLIAWVPLFSGFLLLLRLYLQELFRYSALITAVCLPPTAVSGIIANVSSHFWARQSMILTNE